jgi:hypothetical protein
MKKVLVAFVTRGALLVVGAPECRRQNRVAFATAAQWVARLAEAHHGGTLQAEPVKLSRVPVLVVDEVGYIPFESEAANLFFQLVSSRYERASLIVTSNMRFSFWPPMAESSLLLLPIAELRRLLPFPLELILGRPLQTFWHKAPRSRFLAAPQRHCRSRSSSRR